MSMNVSGGEGGGKRRRGTPTTVAEINVTPMVDVMMVLLIIFMVATPLMQQGVEINLPKSSDKPSDPVVLDRLIILINNQNEVSVGGQPVDRGMLRAKLQEYYQKNKNFQVFMRADREVKYGFIAKVVAEVTAAKFAQIGMMTKWDSRIRL